MPLSFSCFRNFRVLIIAGVLSVGVLPSAAKTTPLNPPSHGTSQKGSVWL